MELTLQIFNWTIKLTCYFFIYTVRLTRLKEQSHGLQMKINSFLNIINNWAASGQKLHNSYPAGAIQSI